MCSRELGDVVEALGEGAGWREALRGVRPMRDALLWVPALLGFVTTAIAAFALATPPVAEEWAQEPSGGVVAFAAAMLVLSLVASSIVFGVIWIVWAVLVTLVAWIAGRGRAPVPLRPAPVVAALAMPEGSLAARWRRVAGAITARQKPIVYGLLIVLAIAELVVELRNPTSIFRGPLTGVAIAVGLAVAGQVCAGLFLVPMAGAYVSGLREVIDRILPLIDHARRDRMIASARDLGAARDAHTRGRGRAEGIARSEGDALIAPISGRRCLAYRLTGSAGALLVDDGATTTFAVRTSEGDVLVRKGTAFVALPPATTTVELDEEQRARAAAFLAARSLPFDAGDLELGESVLLEGEPVVVHGAEHTEAAPGADYRSVTTRRVLDDADGPILIERVSAE